MDELSPGPWDYAGSTTVVNQGHEEDVCEVLDADGHTIAYVHSTSDMNLVRSARSLLDRIRRRMDRCPCHEEPFDPDNLDHEGRGGGKCAECEADADILSQITN